MEEIHGSSVLILGYGREGKSAEAWLRKHYPSITITIRDKARDGDKYLVGLDEFDTIIRSPGVSPYTFTTSAYVTSATNIFFSKAQGKTIGITGTKGKSTTTSLIAHVLSGFFSDVRICGNIGTPALDVLDGSTNDTIFVMELSSHQLVDSHYSPNIAVLLNVSPEHLDYYPDFESYKKAKEHIYQFQQKGDVVFRYPFPIYTASDAALLGNHDNIDAAVSVAKYLGIPDTHIVTALKSFTPLPHRLENVGTYHGITFINDSLATIPQAVIHALKSLGPVVSTLIAGGFDRGVDISSLGSYLPQTAVRTLILFPSTGEKIWESIPQQKQENFQKVSVSTMKEAVTAAYAYTPHGKFCLLSPAAASFNTFKNYADRGNQFKEWVRKLGG